MTNLIRLSDAVSELSVAMRDNDRTTYLHHLVLAKSVLRDLRINQLNAFKRVYLKVNRETATVKDSG